MCSIPTGSRTDQPGAYPPKSASQLRHMVGARIEIRDGNWDFVQETAYQFGGARTDSVSTTNATSDQRLGIRHLARPHLVSPSLETPAGDRIRLCLRRRRQQLRHARREPGA